MSDASDHDHDHDHDHDLGRGDGPPHPIRGGIEPHAWQHRVTLTRPTFIVFAIFAACLWLNALIDHYRFNVALAVLASVPALVLMVRGAWIARGAARS